MYKNAYDKSDNIGISRTSIRNTSNLNVFEYIFGANTRTRFYEFCQVSDWIREWFKNIAVILCGGNLDLSMVPKMIELGQKC